VLADKSRTKRHRNTKIGRKVVQGRAARVNHFSTGGQGQKSPVRHNLGINFLTPISNFSGSVDPLTRLPAPLVVHPTCNNAHQFQSQRSNSPGRLMLRPGVRPNGKADELQTWYTDGARRPASPTTTVTSKVKIARSRHTYDVLAETL